MYINENDLKFALHSQEITTLKRYSGAVETAINAAIHTVRDNLSQIYDIDLELTKTGDSRKVSLVRLTVHIAVWYLCVAEPLVDQDGKKSYLYEKALEELKSIRKGDILTDLPKYEDKPGLGARYGFSEDIQDQKF
ncbi:MAG: DUF1320 family protein [Bacteroidales bacterium]|nr:DUF1320 family protein [Bacteroidales bacterium]